MNSISVIIIFCIMLLETAFFTVAMMVRLHAVVSHVVIALMRLIIIGIIFTAIISELVIILITISLLLEIRIRVSVGMIWRMV